MPSKGALLELSKHKISRLFDKCHLVVKFCTKRLTYLCAIAGFLGSFPLGWHSSCKNVRPSIMDNAILHILSQLTVFVFKYVWRHSFCNYKINSFRRKWHEIRMDRAILLILFQLTVFVFNCLRLTSKMSKYFFFSLLFVLWYSKKQKKYPKKSFYPVNLLKTNTLKQVQPYYGGRRLKWG